MHPEFGVYSIKVKLARMVIDFFQLAYSTMLAS
jgi:hypothetical protein